MDVLLYVFLGVFVCVVAAIFVIVGFSVVQQRRTPLEERVEQAKRKLLDSETLEGCASIRTGYRIGVTDDMVREAAVAASLRWTGYSGLNDQVLNFQRAVPSDQSKVVHDDQP